MGLKPIIFLILATVPHMMAVDEDVCNFSNGDYKTLRFSDGKIFLFKGQKYYSFLPGELKNAQFGTIKDISPYDSSPIDQCFINNGKVFYVRGNEAVIYDDGRVTRIDWNKYKSSVSHLIIRRNGQITGFFAPPVSPRFGLGQSNSMSNNLNIMAYGGGSLSTFNVNGIYGIKYNGYNIPAEFNAFMVNPDNSITFFENDKYCNVTKNSLQQNFDWKDVKTLFGC